MTRSRGELAARADLLHPCTPVSPPHSPVGTCKPDGNHTAPGGRTWAEWDDVIQVSRQRRRLLDWMAEPHTTRTPYRPEQDLP